MVTSYSKVRVINGSHVTLFRLTEATSNAWVKETDQQIRLEQERAT